MDMFKPYGTGMEILEMYAGLAASAMSAFRRYAKSETYGTGLMDMGVGALMLDMLLVCCTHRAFPRRYAKSETYGTGLMDMGVGAMMLGGGMVSRAARVGNHGQPRPSL